MPLIPKIVEVSRDHTGHAYVLVEFRARRDGPVVLTEEFVMQIPETRKDPDTGEPVPVDARAVMRENIARFAEKADAANWRGDLTEGPPGVHVRQRDRDFSAGMFGELKQEVGAEVTAPVRVR